MEIGDHMTAIRELEPKEWKKTEDAADLKDFFKQFNPEAGAKKVLASKDRAAETRAWAHATLQDNDVLPTKAKQTEDGEQPAGPDVSMGEPERTAASPLETTVKELVKTGIEKEVTQIIHEGIAAEVLINKEREAAAARTAAATIRTVR